MSQINWFQAFVDVLQTIFSGIFVALAIYWLDERRAKRDRKLSDFRIASNWFQTEPKASLRGFDLSKTNLSGYKFVGANLEEASLKRSKMWATIFSQANLRRADFRQSKIVGARFDKSVAILVDFSNAVLLSRKEPDFDYIPDFTGAVLVYGKFRKAQLEGCLMTHANLKGVDFAGATVLNCDFSGSDLSESKWEKVKRVENCIWKDVKGVRADNFPVNLLKEIQAQNRE